MKKIRFLCDILHFIGIKRAAILKACNVKFLRTHRQTEGKMDVQKTRMDADNMFCTDWKAQVKDEQNDRWNRNFTVISFIVDWSGTCNEFDRMGWSVSATTQSGYYLGAIKIPTFSLFSFLWNCILIVWILKHIWLKVHNIVFGLKKIIQIYLRPYINEVRTRQSAFDWPWILIWLWNIGLDLIFCCL